MRQHDSWKTWKTAALSAVIIFLAVSFVGFYRWQDPTALHIKKYIKYNILHMLPRSSEGEIDGLEGRIRTALYVEGKKTTDIDYDESKSMERAYWGRNRTRLYAYTEGYTMDFPPKTQFDVSRCASYITAVGDGFCFTVSLEHSPYMELTEEMTNGLDEYAPEFPYEDGVDQYIGFYQCRFLLNDRWQKNNSVIVTPVETFDACGHKGYVFHSVIDGVTSGEYDAYSYLFVRLEDQEFLRVIVKYDKANTELRDSLTSLFDYFYLFEPVGESLSLTDYAPVIPENWSEETDELYHQICESEEIRWGIYVDDISNTGIQNKVPELEEKLEYPFDVILTYVHATQAFPKELMETCWENGKIVELTYQLTENNNSDLTAHSIMLDLYRGEGYDAVRNFAREARLFRHPFLLRLCNEMNSDWTSYGGINNMADPELFVNVWRNIYEIFEEEQVDNCIWVFNPNDRNCPPSHWNEGCNYYPGNEYVQIYGITGYNNGTYYAKWAEEWREFDTIYDAIEEKSTPMFERFPWMITEFASSSIGGDKAAWITHMFEEIDNYPNIKIAVWFSSADYDVDGTVARPYWLDETPETLDAFRKGLH